MSHYTKTRGKYRDETCLADGLRDLGYIVEVHAEAQTLYDYHGRPRPEVAHIIIRRQHTGFGASNDIGFRRVGPHEFEEVISDYDRGKGLNDAWVGRVRQAVAARAIIKEAAAQGLALVAERDAQGRLVADATGHIRLRVQETRVAKFQTQAVRRLAEVRA